MKWLSLGSLVLLIIGGLNWLLIGMARFNLVESLFGPTSVARFGYSLVGLAAIVVLAQMIKSGFRGELFADDLLLRTGAISARP